MVNARKDVFPCILGDEKESYSCRSAGGRIKNTRRLANVSDDSPAHLRS